MREIIYGKNDLERIVSIEPAADHCLIYCQETDGSIIKKRVPNSLYALYPEKHSNKMITLKGDQLFKYLYETKDLEKFQNVMKKNYQNGDSFFIMRDPKEAFMVRNGYTYYKGMNPKDLRIYSFDLEHTFGIGSTPTKDGKLLIISTVCRDHKGRTRKRLFCLDEFNNTPEDMLKAFISDIQAFDPSVVLGHNIFMHDLQILQHVSEKLDVPLNLGRDQSEIKFHPKPSRFRKDGSQSYDYFNALIHGRELIDTYFLALKYDVGRSYESYGLKSIIQHEGLEKKDRQHYDASQIKKDWQDPDKRDMIKKYASDDAEDALKLFDLMASSYFYYTQSIPRSFQSIINSASGSQLNSLMIRSYLQDGHSIAEGDEKEEFEGAISLGRPGIYKNVFKIDCASLYPSIMRQWKIFSKEKDPNGYLSKIVEYFTLERLANKKKFKETKLKHYEDLSNSQKIIINSMYGFLGAPKLNYNYPEGAASVTRWGRKILKRAIKWVKEKEFQLVNCDTDSVSFTKRDKKKFSVDEKQELLNEINGLMPELIHWEDDGLFRTVIVVKKKNYVLEESKGKIKVKGSALKASMKEYALKTYINEVIGLLLSSDKAKLYPHYMSYVSRIEAISDIKPWSSKKTMTKSIIDSNRTQEDRLKAAVGNKSIQEGDRFYVFFETKDKITLEENFEGIYYKPALFKKLYNSLKIFKNIIDPELFPNYSLKKYHKEK